MILDTFKKSTVKNHLKILNGGISAILVAQSIWLPNLVFKYYSNTSILGPIDSANNDTSMKRRELKLYNFIKK